MKIDRVRLKKSTSELPLECQSLINRLRSYTRSELLDALSQIKTWTFGKCELYYWIDVLDLFDSILEEAADFIPDNKWSLACDTHFKDWEKKLLLWTLHFTTLLMEHSFSRHLYNSMEHLITLLSSSDMSVVLGVLNLLYMFSKRSNFITRLNNEKRQALLSRLHHLAESWGGKENGFGLADCCDSTKPIPASATTLHFEFYNDSETKDTKNKQYFGFIHIENVDKINKTPAEIMKGLINLYDVPAEKEMWLFTHVRLAHRFADYKSRLLCVQARLQALSCLVYSNALQEAAHTLLYNGLLEELVELLELQAPYLVEIRSAALRTLTSIIHLDRNPHFPKKPGSRLNMIIDVTGASQYHGFLPVLVRNCITSLTTSHKKKQRTKKKSSESSMESAEEDDNSAEKQMFEFALEYINLDKTVAQKDGRFPLPLATALFSFLYHLASYETGGEALVSCGMMEALLNVINWPGNELEHITFVTRAVRVIDLITNIDMQAFQTHGGLTSFINRLDIEVNLCRKEQSFEIKVRTSAQLNEPSTSSAHEAPAQEGGAQEATPEQLDDYANLGENVDYSGAKTGKTCLPQRAALLKSMLNFLKKALQDATFIDSIRHVMQGTLPSSLKHIISNAEYYGPSLFLLATDVVTVYVFQEPSLLSALQDNGLTDVVLHALLIKDVPATREVLGSLPNVFSALCLNSRGLASFEKCRPFERLFKVLLSPTYLAAMRRRRSTDPIGDTASNLGNAMDELMRHQPSLKVVATTAIIKLLEELCQLGTDPKYVCWRAHNKSEVSPVAATRPATNTEGSSDEEDDDEEEASTSSHTQREDSTEQQQQPPSEKMQIALVDYILNVMKFVDAILSNNSTDDHCREFVNQGGLVPLLKILGLPNLPVDYPVTAAAQAVASVCKSVLNLAHEPKVLKQGFIQLKKVLQDLAPLYMDFYTDAPGDSSLLYELANAPNLETAFNNPADTPLLHAMGAAHGYVLMFVHVCRTGQSDIRNLSMQYWASEEGLDCLERLAELYTSLVWESTVLLALCSDDIIPSNCEFAKEYMDKLNIPESGSGNGSGTDSNGMTLAMEALSTNPSAISMEVDSDSAGGCSVSGNTKPTSQQLKYIKPLLGASSRLGRALAELFGLLVKLCVGSPIRQRRGQNTPLHPSVASCARSIAEKLNALLRHGLDSKTLPPSPIPKFRLTFLICSVGFTSPMLFDEKRYPYHLMLQKFVTSGGLKTFFKTFHWALSAGGTIPLENGLEDPNLPEGTGEFLDAWLTLLEKLVNPKAILDSPNVISANRYSHYKFDELKFLQGIQKLAFEAVMLMWGKKPLPTYGVRMSESMLTILRHILRAEKIIKEKKSKEERERPAEGDASTSDGASQSSSSHRPENNISSSHLHQLMDMGFSRDRCQEALERTSCIEMATEYLLSLSRAPPNIWRPNSTMDVETTQRQPVWFNSSTNNSGATPKPQDQQQEELEPLPKEQITQFTQNALQHCLDLIDAIPDTVYKVCELLVAIMKRNGLSFRNKLLLKLLSKIIENADYILRHVDTWFPDKPENFVELIESEQAARLGYCTHLYTLLFEGPTFNDIRVPCAIAVKEAEILPQLIELVTLAEKILPSSTKPIKSPKWLTPILLLLDQAEKVAISTQRKRDMHMCTTRVWKWFDLNYGKWCDYAAHNNEVINEAYWNGESNAHITIGRRRYTLTFSNMCQMNDQTESTRPITMNLVDFAKNHDPEKSEEMDVDKGGYSQKEKLRNIVVPGIKPKQAARVVKSCVQFMALIHRMQCNKEVLLSDKDLLHSDKDLLHAIMRVCLRYTRDYKNAKIFAQEGGVKLLLKLKQPSGFTGFLDLASLLIRHVLEEPQTLASAMEKVIRAKTLLNIPPAYKELLYMLRQISGAVCRNPEVFLQVAKRILRIEMQSFRKLEEDYTKMILRCEPPSRSFAVPMEEEVAVDVIFDLLNALILPVEPISPIQSAESPDKPPSSTPVQIRECIYSRSGSGSDSIRVGLSSSSSDILNSDVADDVMPGNQILRVRLTRSSSENVLKSNVEEEAAQKHLLSKSAILKLLAEAVRSYGAVAKLITEFQYTAGSSDLITEDCTALAFMLDKLLSSMIDDCSIMTRILIVSLASCNHSPDSQATVVHEVKHALVRASALPESADKHTRIQRLSVLILTMIEINNNIIKVMVRKGIFVDLARMSHCLDLSSPSFPITINAILKPLEAGSRIVNQPVSGNAPNKFSKKNQSSNAEDNGGTQSGTASTETTNAQGEENTEDAENTEHNSIIASHSLSPIETQSAAPQRQQIIDDIMEELLERGNMDPNRTMDIDESNIGYNNERDESGDSNSDASDHEVDDEENDDDVDGDEIDEEDENDDNNFEDEDRNEGNEYFRGGSPVFRVTSNDSEDDCLMIEYGRGSDRERGNNTSVIRWNENGVSFETIDEPIPVAEAGVPSNHPLLSSRPNTDSAPVASGSRTRRPNCQRRYPYLQIHNTSTPVILNSPFVAPGMPSIQVHAVPTVTTVRGDRRVIVTEGGFSFIANAEEQIDFVDQSGYLFGPSLSQTLNNVPSALHWWNEEGKLLDGESQPDCCVSLSHQLAGTLLEHLKTEIAEKKKRREKEEEEKKNSQSTKSSRNKYKKGSSEVSSANESSNDPEAKQTAETETATPTTETGNEKQQDTDDESNPTPIPASAEGSCVSLQQTDTDAGSEESAPKTTQDSSEGTADASSQVRPSIFEEDTRSPIMVNESSNDSSNNDGRNPPRNDIIATPQPERFVEDTGSPVFFNNSSTSMNRGSETNEDSLRFLVPVDEDSSDSSPPFTFADELPTIMSHDDRDFDMLTDIISRHYAGHLPSPPQFSVSPFSRFNQLPNPASRPTTARAPEPEPASNTSDSAAAAAAAAASASQRGDTTDESTSNNASNVLQEDLGLLSNEIFDSTSEHNTASDDETVVHVSTETVTTQTVATPQEESATPSQAQPETIDDDIEVPEGVDPSFFAALPPDMRRDVIEQQRLNQLQARASRENAESNASTSALANSTTDVSEVSEDFLAALPLRLQQEVLQQLRLEQQLREAARSNPDEPVDTVAFFETLPPSLRTMILSDIEDSQMAALPPDLAAEAQTLRRTWEERNRQMSQDSRIFHSNLTEILRRTSRGRISSRFHTHIVPQRNQWNSWGRPDHSNAAGGASSGNVRVRGRQMLDHESLSCLLVLLFSDDPKLQTLRLHRVIRNFCYHGPTRDWIIKALLSIIERSVSIKPEVDTTQTTTMPSGKLKRSMRPGPLVSKLTTDPKNASNGATWLNIKLDAALGCRANVFIVNKGTGKRNDRAVQSSITLHPQAAPVVCRQALDLFISLSKSFPAFLLPLKLKDETKDSKEKTASSPTKVKSECTDFWHILLKLDSTSSKKGKCVLKVHCNSNPSYVDTDTSVSSFDQSPFGQLLSKLSSPVIYRSTQLTDKLLRLLSVITMALPELNQYAPNNKNPKPKGQRLESICAPESALALAINVLKYKSCSEEGLEDVTTLLLNISNCSLDMSYVILKLLLFGAQQIGEVVTGQIQKMLEELQCLNKKQKKKDPGPEQRSSKGVLTDRFTNESVVITASTKVKASCDLQLPSMAPLVSKSSNQIFFLRVLRVIVQIREAIKKGLKIEQEKQEAEEKSAAAADDENASMDTTSSGGHKELEPLSEQLHLEKLWETLSKCLLELEHTNDHHAVLVLQHTVEAFFLVYSPQQGTSPSAVRQDPVTEEEDDTVLLPDRAAAVSPTPSTASKSSQIPADQCKFLSFAEKHRTVLNQILRQSTAHLADGPFAVLVNHTRILDFDVKRRYFRTELERLDQGIRREELPVHVRRSHVFEDSFKELYRRTPEEWKNRFYIVFEDEEGQDAGGLLREWYVIISRDIFNPMYALFTVSPGDRVTYMINPASHCNPNHLCYFKFVGRVIAKAIYDNKLLECYFTRSFYKHILGIAIKYTDIQSEDYSFYNGLVYLMEHNVETLGYDITFSIEEQEIGVTETRDLKPNGRNIIVTEETKMDYIRLSCQMKMTGAIKEQLKSFLEGFYEIIPMRLISIFNEQELELLISGLPNVDIDELKANTEYHKYQSNSLQIQWFWRALRSFDQADRANFLQFVTGTSKVPLQGFGALEGMNGVQKFQIHRDDRSTERLPSAHTCFNQLDLPVYETYDKLHANLLKAIHYCSEGFGFA